MATVTRALETDLTAAVRGEVRFDEGSRAVYAYDGSIYRQVPIGVVVPRDADDVVAALAVCRAHDAPILGRGCGTSLAGQCCNHAVVFDFSKSMHGIVDLDPDRRLARVQPGTICDTLRNAAERHGLTFGPDPATHDHCTLGGMIGNNSCGTHSLMAGKTVDNVEELEVITYDGHRLTLARGGATGSGAAGERARQIVDGLTRIRDRYAQLVRERYPDIPRRVSGYNLDELLPERGLHVARAFVGTESTCALVLQATVRLVPSPPHRPLVVAGFPDTPAGADRVPEILEHRPIGLESFDGHVVRNLDAKRFHFPGERALPEGDAWLLIEFGGWDRDEVDDAARALVSRLRRGAHPPDVKLCADPQQANAVWEIRRHCVGSTRMPAALGGHPGWPNWEDAAVAPAVLGRYLRDQEALLRRYGYDAAFYGHFGQGCVHSRIDFDLRTREGIARFRAFMEDAADLVVAYGGSLSGEHGDGHGRAELLPKMFGPELIQAFREFKAVWDPKARMNPGKMVDPYRMDEHLREGAGYRPLGVSTYFRFPEDAGSLGEAAGRCFGVGKCRHLDGGTMCPSFMVTREEEHSTRGRARLLSEMLRGDGVVARDGWRSEAVKDALHLCLACKGCKGDCPVRVDMASYKAEFLAHYYAGRLRPPSAYAMGLIAYWARAAALVPGLANGLLHARGLARVLKLVAGIDPRREVPAFAPRTFRAWFQQRRSRAGDGRPVLLWTDTFNNYFHPQTAAAATEVLEAAGFRVMLPPSGLCCGRPLYDYGMLRLARQTLRHVVDVLRPYGDAGVPIVGLEPSCVAVFRDELGNLMPDDPAARAVQHRVHTLAELLERYAPDWTPPRLPRRALVQRHCHQSAVLGFDADRRLLTRMGLDAEIPDSGCCGMAGSFGYEKGERYEVSMRCGERVLLPQVRAASADTLIVADGFSCREQIAQATTRRALHLAEVLDLGLREGVQKLPTAFPERSWHHPAATANALPASARVLIAGGALAAFGVAAWAMSGTRRM